MLCEKAYYKNGTGENMKKLYCSDERMQDFDGKCPLIYWCKIDEKYENTTDMFNCIYRGKENDRL